jgi:endonuclease/exonuclease/phosphatase (EEP) superfamily protein YafD
MRFSLGRVNRSTKDKTSHLTFIPEPRRLARDLGGHPGPHVLTGALNLTSEAVGRCPRCVPSRHRPRSPRTPEQQLDHILTDDPGLVATDARAPEMLISGHRPLIVDIQRRD